MSEAESGLRRVGSESKKRNVCEAAAAVVGGLLASELKINKG